jgi:hypothetical protein
VDLRQSVDSKRRGAQLGFVINSNSSNQQVIYNPGSNSSQQNQAKAYFRDAQEQQLTKIYLDKALASG